MAAKSTAGVITHGLLPKQNFAPKTSASVWLDRLQMTLVRGFLVAV
ncbi:hypothetical protein [Propionivibrio sp.]|nr:hypothetical protein [Propionivibrio sp.]MBK8744496.1 hypothetical protein [Propionivibrio sp.]